MRFTISNMMIATAVVAATLQPIASFFEWTSNRSAVSTFFVGLYSCLRTATFRNWRDTKAIWESVSQGDYISDYLAGQVLGWTLIVLAIWAIAFRLSYGKHASSDAEPSRRRRRRASR